MKTIIHILQINKTSRESGDLCNFIKIIQITNIRKAWDSNNKQVALNRKKVLLTIIVSLTCVFFDEMVHID